MRSVFKVSQGVQQPLLLRASGSAPQTFDIVAEATVLEQCADLPLNRGACREAPRAAQADTVIDDTGRIARLIESSWEHEHRRVRDDALAHGARSSVRDRNVGLVEQSQLRQL